MNNTDQIGTNPRLALLVQSAQLVPAVLAQLEQRAATFMDAAAENLGHLEEVFFLPLMELGRIALQEAAQKKAAGVPLRCPPCGRKLTRKRVTKTTLPTRFGPIVVKRARGYCQKCGAWFCPADLVLGIQTGRTPFVAEMAALFAANSPIAQAAPMLRRATGIELAPATLDRAARQVGRAAQAKRTVVDRQVCQGPPAGPGPLPPEPPFTLVVEIDAWNIRERGEHWGQSAALRAAGQKPEWWHWAYTGTVFRLSDRVQTQSGRPLILSRGYACTRGGIEALRAQLHAEAIRHGLGRAARVLVVADGAVWIWNLTEDRFPEAIQRLDLYHAKAHLWAVAAALHGEGTPAARAWIQPLEAQLEAGAAPQMIRQLEELLPTLETQTREQVQKEVNYFQNNAARMDYAEAKKRGEPCGSGAIESTCAQYQKRFKCTGQFWTTAGDEGLLCIQTFWRNNRWHELFPHAAGFDLSNN